MIAISVLLVLLMPCNSISVMHEYHVSKCEIEYKVNKQQLQISQFVFLDDLEKALEQEGHANPSYFTKFEKPSADSILMIYIENHFAILQDETKHTLNYIGREMSEDLSGMYLFLTVENVSSPSKISVASTLLVDVFSDQNNLIYWTNQNKSKHYYSLTKNKPTVLLSNE
jgi:hypothetical protein